MSSRISAEGASIGETVAQAPLPVRAARFTAERGRATDYLFLSGLLALLGAAALWFFYTRNEILLSGDAVAHINIARRVFDSRTPGPLQLGSVWLPLPHLLTIPFIASRRLWQTGLGGSIVSLVSYVLAGLGLFRLLSRWSRASAWAGVVVFVANPNLLYTQTTALNEPLYLTAFLWTMVFVAEAAQLLQCGDTAAGNRLEKAALILTAAILTRYDGWFLGGFSWLAIMPMAISAVKRMPPPESRKLRKSLVKALLLTALGPALWLGYNLGAYGNALDFANGPYSAKAIAKRTTEKNAPPYPGQQHPWTAGVYFTKAAQLNIGEGRSAKTLVWLAALSSLLIAARREWLPIALLWSPLVFYALSIAYGSVPIFMPVWWPFSYYNVRYGLELLPAISAGIALFIYAINRLIPPLRIRIALAGIAMLMLGVSYVSIWRTVPICLREVRANGSGRMQLEEREAALLRTFPSDSVVLAYTSAHSGAFELAGFPLRRTINEGNEFTWDVALLSPVLAADYVVASAGDPVAIAVANHSEGLTVIARIAVPGQPTTIVYKSARRKRRPEGNRPRNSSVARRNRWTPQVFSVATLPETDI